jgi:stage II sporulation protein P
MDREGKILRLGAAVLICATLIRVICSAEYRLQGEQLLEWMFLWQTGYRVEHAQHAAPEPIPTLPPDFPFRPVVAEQTLLPLVVGNQDLERVQLQNGTPYPVDKTALFKKPLDWNLRSDRPTVLILHTHATESYTQTEDYEESTDYRTLDENYNMVSIGAELARCLEAEGIPVIHDKTAYDHPSYSGSYNRAREAVEQHLKENPSICLVLDLHRDAMEGEDGKQLGYTQQTEEGEAAKLMVVCGSDAGGLDYPNWQENLSLALKLQTQLEALCPGICRNINLRSQRFNQDLSPGAMLIEVGASGNTRQEVLRAADVLAQGILSLAHGSKTS